MLNTQPEEQQEQGKPPAATKFRVRMRHRLEWMNERFVLSKKLSWNYRRVLPGEKCFHDLDFY